MTRQNFKIFLFLIFAAYLGFLSAQDSRTVLSGRSASCLLERNGRFMIAYQNSQNGLSLALNEAPFRETQVYNLVSIPAVHSPVIKKSRTGEIGIVWVEYDRGESEIHFGRIKDNGLLSARTVFRSELPLFSPDLDFDDSLNPWITWIQGTDQKFLVCVANLTLKKTWIINRPYFASAVNPKVLANGRGGIWVVWTGRDKGRDEIFGCVFQGNAWSKPFKLNDDDAYPHTSQSVGLDGNGCPWVVWSAYDGRDYEIFSSSWNGETWSPEEQLTDNERSDTSPGISFIFGTVPLVVWSRISDRTSIICARFRRGAVWSTEIPVVLNQEKPLRSPKIVSLGDRVGLTWESGEQIESLVLPFSALASRTGLPADPQAPLPILNLSRDTNQSVGFGDSITYAEDQGYIPRLERLLIQRYGTAKIWNAGEPGETTAEGLARIDRIIAATQSLYMLLMEGTNDVIFLDISMDAAAFNLKEMARKCLRSGMLPLIATIIPRKDWRWYSSVYQNRIFDLNSKIRTLASNLSIPIVDQYNAFYDYPVSDGGWQSLLLDDGVHPNSKGYEVMAEAWFDGLKSQKDVLTVTAPNGGESRQANTAHEITWTSEGTVGDVRIELSTDGGTNYSDIVSSTPNDGSYSWTIPYLNATGSNCLVRISEASDGDPADTSDSPFTITPPPKPKAPLNPALDTRLDTTETKKINKLTWQANSENAAIPLKNYKVYRKGAGQADSAFALLASVSASTLQYEDTNLEILQKYSYRLTTLATNNDESDPSSSVTETKKFEFPPLNPAVQTAINRILFYQEKHTTITFEKNPLNDEAEVSGYELYRRKAGGSEDEFTILTTLNASTFSYKYIIRPPESLTQKYDYALKTTFTDGRKSRLSAVAAEN